MKFRNVLCNTYTIYAYINVSYRECSNYFRRLLYMCERQSKSVFIEHDRTTRGDSIDQPRTSRTNRTEDALYSERTRISRIASSNGQSSDGNRVALIYNAIPIDGCPWKTRCVCKALHVYTYVLFFMYRVRGDNDDLSRALNTRSKFISFCR